MSRYPPNAHTQPGRQKWNGPADLSLPKPVFPPHPPLLHELRGTFCDDMIDEEDDALNTYS